MRLIRYTYSQVTRRAELEWSRVQYERYHRSSGFRVRPRYTGNGLFMFIYWCIFSTVGQYKNSGNKYLNSISLGSSDRKQNLGASSGLTGDQDWKRAGWKLLSAVPGD